MSWVIPVVMKRVCLYCDLKQTFHSLVKYHLTSWLLSISFYQLMEEKINTHSQHIKKEHGVRMEEHQVSVWSEWRDWPCKRTPATECQTWFMCWISSGLWCSGRFIVSSDDCMNVMICSLSVELLTIFCSHWCQANSCIARLCEQVTVTYIYITCSVTSGGCSCYEGNKGSQVT